MTDKGRSKISTLLFFVGAEETMLLPKINDIVIYGNAGVCEVAEIKRLAFSGSASEYFVLKPVDDKNATVFLPLENEALLKRVKPVMSVAEAYELINAMPSRAENWIENDVERKRRYAEILNGGDRADVVSVMKTLYFLRRKKEAAGKKLRISDEGFLKEAEKQLYGELSYVLNIPSENVPSFICERLGIDSE